MATMALVQAEVEEGLKKRAEEVLALRGETLEEAVRALVERTAAERDVQRVSFAPGDDGPKDPGYDVWFREQIEEAMADDSPGIPQEEVERQWAVERAALLNRANVCDAA
jgi:hypothetical protein